MSLSFTLFYITLTSVLISHSFQFDCGSSVPVDFSKYSTTNYYNLILYFTSASSSTDFLIQIDPSDFSLLLNGDIGTLTVDENSNNRLGESKSYAVYTSNQIKIYSSSINKFFGGLTDFELVLEYKLKRVESDNINFKSKFASKLYVSFPVVMKNSELYYIDNSFFTELNNKIQRNTISDPAIIPFQNINSFNGKNMHIQINNFNVEQTLIRDNYLNYFKQFYFFNSNSISCSKEMVTWIVMNDFILINNTNQVFLKNIFKDMNIDSTTSSINYYNKYKDVANNDLTIYRNFLIDNDYISLENQLLGIAQSSSSRKISSLFNEVIKMIVYIIIILIL